MLFCLCGFHATVAYSSLGLINMLYAVSLTLGQQSLMLELIESVMSFMYNRKRTGPRTEP